MMKKLTIVFVVILLIILVFTLKDTFSIDVSSKSENKPAAAIGPIENNEGQVSVSVKPLNLENSSITWDFEISLNTHSENLSQDLLAVSELVGDQGKSYKPTAWEGAPPEGHHRQGILKFEAISPRPKSIELKIKNIGGISERNFKWIF